MNQTMGNWREMEAGLELDWIIAQADGWHDDGKERLGESPGHSKLWIGLVKEGEADFHSVVFNKADGSVWSSSLPSYSVDLNAAWRLFDELPTHLTPRLVRMLQGRGDHLAHYFKASIIDSEKREELYEEADTPAVAISRAFLAWKEAQP